MNAAIKKEVWLTFAGLLDVHVTRAMFNFFANAVNENVTTAHLLIQSPGGNVSDGIALFNYFDTLPIDLIAYNAGSVASAAAIAYLGARKRIVCESGAFMIHQTIASPGHNATGDRLQGVVDSLHIDDARTKLIFNSRIKLSDEQRSRFAVADLNLDARQSIECGLAHEIGQFAPKGAMYHLIF